MSTSTTVAETDDQGRRTSNETRKANEAASKAQPQPPHVPKCINKSLVGERGGCASIDPADEAESQGAVGDPDDMVDDPGGCAGHLLAHTGNPPACEDETGTSNQAAVTVDTESTTNSMGPSTGSASLNATGDTERHPDEPTEPLDQPFHMGILYGDNRY